MDWPDLPLLASHGPGFPDRKTLFDAILDCGKQKDLLHARYLHSQILLNDLFPKDIYVSNALLSMYSKCGAIEDAQRVFDQFPSRDVVSWNALISGYSHNQVGGKSIVSFLRMQDEGILPNFVTFISLLKACSSLRCLRMGESIHAHIVNQGSFERNIVLNNGLVDMYAKCGMLEKAQQVFDEIPVHDTVSWNALITGYAHHGLGREALKCFKKMQAEGFSPDEITFICVLNACGSIKSIEMGEEIHTEVERRGLLKKKVGLGNALVDMYAKCDALVKAQNVFNELPVRDVVTWNTMITGYVQHGYNQEALNCFCQMQDEGVFPNAVTFICCLKACGNIRSLYMGEELHAQASKKGLVEKDIVLGTTLVDMYAKCGILRKAQEVFDELPLRNIETWNALIGGYAQHGLAEEALRCYRQMRDENVAPDAITFVCMLKACGNKGQQEIYAEISKQGLLEKDLVLGNALVDMYAKCGMLEKARSVSKELPSRDVVTWSSLISGYAQHGLGEEALLSYRNMCEEGIFPDMVTFICILRSCTTAGSLKLGEEICEIVTAAGLLEKNVFLGNALVDMYVKCGVLGKAQEIFDELPVRDVVSWTTLIAGYSQHDLNHEALSCFRKMQREGLPPNAVTFISILKVCGNMRLLELGEEIHAEIHDQRLLVKVVGIGTALVGMYSKCGAIEKARKVFDEIPLRDIVSWNALIAGFTHCGLSNEAVMCYRQMQDESLSPDAITFICVLKACSGAQSLGIGKETHAIVSRLGFVNKNVVLSTALVDMYARCGELRTAQEVFDELPERNVVSWNVLIAGYAQYKHNDECLKCFTRMRNEGILPDAVTFISIMKVCGTIGCLELGDEICGEIRKQRLLEKDVALGTSLVDMFVKCGAITKAREVFDGLPIRNVESWNAIIAGYAARGAIDEALECFKKMQGEEEAERAPNVAAYVCMLKACGAMGCLSIGEEMHGEALKQQGNLALETAVLDMYAKCGAMEKAQGVFDEIPVRSLALWTAWMSANAQQGRAKTVFYLFRRMMAEGGIMPDLVALLVLLTSCSHAGLVKEGRMLFEDTDSGYLPVPPSIDHYTCFIDLLGRAGQFCEAVLVIGELPRSDSLPLWLTLLGNCSKWVNVEFGRWAFEQSMQLDGGRDTAYVCMRNLYAADASQQQAGAEQKCSGVKRP